MHKFKLNIVVLNRIGRHPIHAAILLSLCWLLNACEDFVTLDPPRTEVVSETVFDNEAASISAVNGIYSLMMTNAGFANGELERFSGISSDELINYSNNDEEEQFSTNTIDPMNRLLQNAFWREAYQYINNANAIIEGLADSRLKSESKMQLLGEALFIRAFCHFHLVNLFGKVPYVATTDFEINSTLNRDEIAVVYEKIIEDLIQCRTLLRDDSPLSDPLRLRPDNGSATALLARVYLYAERWEEAESMASLAIGNAAYALEQDLDQVFLPDSKEVIWQLKPVIPGDNTQQGNIFILTSPPDGFVKKVSLHENVYNRFEAGDERLTSWVGIVSNGTNQFYFPYKYKKMRDGSSSPSEFSVVFRLAEQYLIRAEARAEQNKIPQAMADLNIIRSRASLPALESLYPSPTQADLLSIIENERISELFTEWGHRWFDLKRTGRANAILSAVKPTWMETSVLYPVPQSELNNNPNLLPQNSGY